MACKPEIFTLWFFTEKKNFALESTVSVLEGSLSTVVYHGHSSALLDVKMKV